MSVHCHLLFIDNGVGHGGRGDSHALTRSCSRPSQSSRSRRTTHKEGVCRHFLLFCASQNLFFSSRINWILHIAPIKRNKTFLQSNLKQLFYFSEWWTKEILPGFTTHNWSGCSQTCCARTHAKFTKSVLLVPCVSVYVYDMTVMDSAVMLSKGTGASLSRNVKSWIITPPCCTVPLTYYTQVLKPSGCTPSDIIGFRSIIQFSRSPSKLNKCCQTRKKNVPRFSYTMRPGRVKEEEGIWRMEWRSWEVSVIKADILELESRHETM